MATLHATLLAAGSQVPTALAVPVAAALSPTAIDAAIVTAAHIAAGNYVAAATTGIPLVIGAVTALYSIFTKTQTGPTDAEIHAAVSRMSHDDLIRVLFPDVPPAAKT